MNSSTSPSGAEDTKRERLSIYSENIRASVNAIEPVTTQITISNA